MKNLAAARRFEYRTNANAFITLTGFFRQLRVQ